MVGYDVIMFRVFVVFVEREYHRWMERSEIGRGAEDDVRMDISVADARGFLES